MVYYSLKSIILKKIDKKINHYNQLKMIKEKFAFNRNIDLLETYKRNRGWIEKNSVPNKGIRPQYDMSDRFNDIAYPEVTGYFIPTLINWGFREKAFAWANWLLSIQHEDGSWFDYTDTDPYTFDTGQILKGLISVYKINPSAKLKTAITKGGDYIISMQEENGNLKTASKRYWYEGVTTELIHLYCLKPLIEISELFNDNKYRECAESALKYYISKFRDKLVDFHTLSHFYAYMIEALIDLGENEIAKEAIDNVARIQKKNGFIPAYKNVDWTCSTGLFQFAICWYKLGEKIRADKTFDYACSLQTQNGGWLGSYGKKASYIPQAEISWASKYFLDALQLKIATHFSNTTDTKMLNANGTYALEDVISEKDERWQSISKNLNIYKDKEILLLDLGCGLGRFLKNIHNKYPQFKLYGCDISNEILEKVPEYVVKNCGSLLNSPYKDNSFDIVMTIEALEHTLDIENALREMYRITKSGGSLFILDKNIKYKGNLEMPPWEQWFDVCELQTLLSKVGFKDVDYESVNKDDEMYILWKAVK